MTHRIRMKTPLAILCSALASSVAPPSAADWIADGNLRGLFDDNVNRALTENDRKADFAFGAVASAGQFLPLNGSTSLTLTGDFRSDVYTQYGGLNQYSLGGAAALKEKLGLGAYAPWVSLAGSAWHADYQSAIRDSWFYNAGITLGKRLSEKWDVRLEYSYLRRRADRTPASFVYDDKQFSGAVFDLDNHNVKLSAAYAYDDKTALSASYAFRTGDAFSTNSQTDDSLTDAIARVATAVTPDSVFGANQVVYKIPASTHSFVLGASRAIGGHSSVNLGYEHHWTAGAGGLTYHVNVVELSFLYSY
jgi:hypothetical protein